MKVFLIFLTNVFLFFSAYAQLDYNSTAKDKKKHTEAQNLVENYNYTEAVGLYLDLVKDNPEDYDLYTELGYCYLNLGKSDLAVETLLKPVNYYKNNDKMGKGSSVEALYFLAEAYYIGYDFDNAKTTYQELLNYSKKNEIEDVTKKIAQCDSAQTMYMNPVGFFVMLPDIINSAAPDYCPVVTADGSRLYFTSRRNGSTGGQEFYDGYEFEDIYYVDVEYGSYSKPKNVGIPVNTKGHEATCSISGDGTELFIYRSDDNDPGDIYYSVLSGNKWSNPVKMDKPINSKGNETHASLSPDGEQLYFTSDRKGGQGGLDIYVAKKDGNGWTDAQNLGSVINSEQDEEGPFVSPDGRYLYFSSKGHAGMGGYDIFRCELQSDGSWGAPVNLGFPLNTVNDDIFYVPTMDPTTAYYSSKQITGVTSIYVVQIYDNLDNMIFVRGYTFDSETKNYAVTNTDIDSVFANGVWFPKNRNVRTAPNDSVYISNLVDNSLVLDSLCKIPTNTKISVYQLSGDNTLGTYNPVKRTGKYGFAINPASNCAVHYTAPNHIYDILEVGPKGGLVEYNAELDTMIVGKIRSVKNTTFVDDNSFTDYQNKEFEVLADFLKDNPDLYVDISSYGKDDAPETMDNIHTNMIVSFLKDKGVQPSHIYKGLSGNTITGSTTEYTIYDSLTIKQALEGGDGNQYASSKVTQGRLVTDVSFAINKYDNPAFYTDLDAIAGYLVENSDAKIAVYGYTDTQGNPDYNKQLSKKRANFVKDYLVTKGADANQIVADGKGYSKQISKNKDNGGNYIWSSLGYNRRVEIVVLEQGSNSKLYVKPVDVPSQFQLNTGDVDYKYSVVVVVSEKQLDYTVFDFDVAELHGIDGLYTYMHGEFNTEQEAINFADSIKDKYPKAFVFINNYRK